MLKQTTRPSNVKFSQHERCTAKLQSIKKKLVVNQIFTPLHDDVNEEPELPQSDLSEHYRISNSCKVYFNITKWLVDNKEDQAVKVCLLFLF